MAETEVNKPDNVDNSEADKKATQTTPAEDVASETKNKANSDDIKPKAEEKDWKAEHDKLKEEIARRDKSDAIKKMTADDNHGAYQDLVERHLNASDNPSNEYSDIMKGIQSYNYKHQETNKGALASDPRSGMAERIKQASDDYDNQRR